MKYSKIEIGLALKNELNKGYNIERISNWADNLLFINIKNMLTPELDDILRHILIMDAGPEFEYSEKELRMLSEMLINEEANPIEKINALKQKN